ncbi:hypothetical protein [Demequina aestuarii]|uniref:hypothetical protein n=1 Tax=Demequina aestuarii TaxID=327095 RepID=UPI000781F63A|nr:hypothetical protein [Demequina aestuarii]
MSNGKAQINDSVALDIPGARGNVTVTGADRIFYKVLIDGEPLKRSRGGWEIPLRNGDAIKVQARGFIPGFQTLYTGDRELLRMGGHVGLAERMAMFLPLLLVIFLFPGLVLGLILFFMNVMAVKNPLMPKAARIGLPIANTIAGAFILLLLPSVVS